MSKLIDLYTNILTSYGLTVTKDGYVKSGDSTVAPEGKPLVLPTKENIDNIVVINGDGKPEVVKTLFNPMSEDPIKGMSASLKKLKSMTEIKLSYTLAAIGEMLLTLSSNKELQKKTNLEINKFLGRLQEAYNPGMKSVVDDKSVEYWGKLYELFQKSGKNSVSIFLKKNGSYGGKTYNRVCTVSFPIYDELVKLDKETPIMGIKLRNKDITVYKLIYQYIFEDMDDKGVVTYLSSDVNVPGLHALMQAYITIGKRCNAILKGLKNIDVELYDTASLPISFSIDNIVNYSEYEYELAVIPNDIDINRSKNSATSSIKANNNVAEVLAKSSRPQVTQLPGLPTHAEHPQQQEPAKLSALEKILGRNNQQQQVMPQQHFATINNPNAGYIMQQQMMPQGPGYIAQQPMYHQPMVMPGNQGYPVYQQPMYNPNDVPWYPAR